MPYLLVVHMTPYFTTYHQNLNELGRTLSLNIGSLMKMTRDEPFGASYAIYDTVTHFALNLIRTSLYFFYNKINKTPGF